MKFRRTAFFAATTILSLSPLAWSEETEQPSPPESQETGAETKDDSEAAAADEKWDSEARQAALKVQLFLDKEGFGPGKIDARWGGFTEKAAKRWSAAGKEDAISVIADGKLDIAKAKELPFSADLLTTYTITEEDQKLLGDLPEEPEEKAKLKHLPYTTLMEVVSEKFHADPDFIREVNELESNSALEVGTKLKVPNVAEPFDISEPMKLAEESEAKEKTEDEDEQEEQSEEDSATKDLKMTVIRGEQTVEVRKDGDLIHSFPISPGANDNQSPAGDWEVVIVSWMPEFRWDKSMLEDGKRSDESHLLPPGPNNPVGIVWIGLSADGIGLHGTPYPDAIGRNRSHGCIRLANWDALKLAKTVTPGTKVTIK